MDTIGLIAAMTQESAALLRHITGAERIAIGQFQGAHFEFAGKACTLVTSGMGMRRAREATKSLVETSAPGLLVSFGIAGAVEAVMQIGDVVLAESVCQFEREVVSPLISLTSWSDAACNAISRALSEHGYSLYAGTAVTTAGSQATQAQLADLLHPILEMETMGIAQVAKENGIPLLSLRAISDGPCAPIPFDLGEVMDEDANLRTGRLLGMILRNPGIIFQSLHMRRNTRLAEESSASALLAALSQADF
jgi:nucleoside phosphorylase